MPLTLSSRLPFLVVESTWILIESDMTSPELHLAIFMCLTLYKAIAYRDELNRT